MKDEILYQKRCRVALGSTFVLGYVAKWPFGKITVYKDRIELSTLLNKQTLKLKEIDSMTKSNFIINGIIKHHAKGYKFVAFNLNKDEFYSLLKKLKVKIK